MQINPRDNYGIMNKEKMKLQESWPTKEQAVHFCKVVNEHEIRNNRKPIYAVVYKMLEGNWEEL